MHGMHITNDSCMFFSRRDTHSTVNCAGDAFKRRLAGAKSDLP